jgi:hypothetical protein
MQQADGTGSILSAEIAESLLYRWLAERSLKPSGLLVQVFGEAGRLAAGREPGRRIVSTRLVLLAAADLGSRAGTVDPESRALKALADLLERDPERLDGFRDRYFDPKKKASDRPPALSENVARTLDKAASSPHSDAGPDSLSLASFLLAYPVAGSKAEELLRDLKITSSEFQAAIRKALEPAISPASAASTPTPTRAVPDSTEAKEEPRKTEPPVKEPEFNERVSTHGDEPATADQLDRAHFAEVLATRIKEARPTYCTEESPGKKLKEGVEEEEKKCAFVVHLHGPWGSGKSSVLNFLRTELQTKSDPKWIVVDFNAWRDQRLKPPWWTLISSIYATAHKKLHAEGEAGAEAAKRLWRQWLWWRMKVDLVPLLVASACMLLLVLVILLGLNTSVDKMLTVIAGALSLTGALFIASRSLALGSQKAAQAYTDLKNDPYQPITKLFEDLIKTIDRPVAVFVDDLDRCDSDYVVDLLEGIQTLMRGAPVTYVVAADRKWICSSFEQRYSGFAEPIGRPGRPLGYLFLDKMFQISAPLPHPSHETRSSYWEGLLNVPSPEPIARATAEKAAQDKVATLTQPEELQAELDAAEKSADPLALPAMRAACAKRIAKQEVVAGFEHRLKAFDKLVEPNPRAMKRLVNAYAMHQSTHYLSGSRTLFDTLVRWTILELRWPLLADFLAERPECLDAIRSPLKEEDLPHVSGSLRRLFGDKQVIDVLGEATTRSKLNTAALESILGSVQGDR